MQKEYISSSFSEIARSCLRPKLKILEHAEAQGSVGRQQRQFAGCWHSGECGAEQGHTQCSNTDVRIYSPTEGGMLTSSQASVSMPNTS
jgi:hypothetical protein